MSLLTLPAFLTRRREDTAMTATATATETPTPVDNVLMRFLTQGGAQVHITHAGTFTQKSFSGAVWGEQDHRWTCLGCGQGSGRHDHYSPSEIRNAANDHATECRSMPKPEA